MKKLLFLFLIVVCNYCSGQNLVINGSFEDHTVGYLPGFCDTFAVSQNVYNPNLGSPDYCHEMTTCASVGVPINTYGFSWPVEGLAYYFIVIYWAEDTSVSYLFREYITLGLEFPLAASKQYSVSYNIRLADSCAYAIDEMSILFTDTLIQYDTNGIIPIVPQINNPHGNYLSDQKSWMEMKYTYIASGGESYITIGNFKNDPNTDSLRIHEPSYFQPGSWGMHNWAGYYIDNVSVVEIRDSIPKGMIYFPNAFSPNNDGANDVFYIRGQSIAEIDLKIYSRWGNLVFESNDPERGWDGRFHGKDCAEGVYFYSASVTFKDGTVELKKGNVTIVR